MATVQELNTEKRNAVIREDYEKLNSQKKFLQAYIFDCLADKYFKSSSTIMQIVFQKGHYKPKENEENQTSEPA